MEQQQGSGWQAGAPGANGVPQPGMLMGTVQPPPPPQQHSRTMPQQRGGVDGDGDAVQGSHDGTLMVTRSKSDTINSTMLPPGMFSMRPEERLQALGYQPVPVPSLHEPQQLHDMAGAQQGHAGLGAGGHFTDAAWPHERQQQQQQQFYPPPAAYNHQNHWGQVSEHRASACWGLGWLLVASVVGFHHCAAIFNVPTTPSLVLWTRWRGTAACRRTHSGKACRRGGSPEPGRGRRARSSTGETAWPMAGLELGRWRTPTLSTSTTCSSSRR